MWLFTIHGVFSVVSAGEGKMQIRARNAEHLRTLKKKCLTLASVPIQTDPDGQADYFARLIVPVLKWQTVAGWLADEATRYTNYKDALAQNAGASDRVLMDWAHSVWQIGMQYQKGCKGGGTESDDEAKYASDDGEPSGKRRGYGSRRDRFGGG